MLKKLFRGIFLFKMTVVLGKEADLPLCPTNVLYLPQHLPMHCRMPTNADFPKMPLPSVPPFYPIPSSDKQPGIPIPVPPIGPMPMPGPMPFPGPMPISGPMPMPGMMPMPGPSHKLPVIVMPFYSPDPAFKKTQTPRKWKIRHKRRRPTVSSSETSCSTDTDASDDTSTSSEYQGWWRGRKNLRRFNAPHRMKKVRHNHLRQVLTPVLQYVTKDGYVIFEKKISNTEAKDWLNVKKDKKPENNAKVAAEAKDMGSNEPNESREKDRKTEDNLEVITKRIAHRLSKLKTFRDKSSRRKNNERPI